MVCGRRLRFRPWPSIRNRGRTNPDHYAPTWSWAGIDGPVSYVSVVGSLSTTMIHFAMISDASEVGEDTGLIRVFGQFEPIEIKMSIIADPRNYHIEISDHGKCILVRVDASLEPFPGMVDGKKMTATVRVAFGEPLPSEDWSGS